MTTIFGPSGTTSISAKAHVYEEVKKKEVVDLPYTYSPEIQMQRVLKAAIYGIMLQLVLVPCITIFLKYPVEFLSGTASEDFSMNPVYISVRVLKGLLRGTISFAGLGTLLIILCATFAFGVNTNVRKIWPRNTAELLKQWFSAKIMFCSVFTGLLTALLSRTFIYVANWGYSNITYTCEDGMKSTTCVHEKHLFVSLCSFVLGFYIFLDCAIHNKFVVKFPTLEKNSMDVIRMAFWDNLGETISIAGRITPLFYIFYYIQGGVFRDILNVIGYSLKESELSGLLQFIDLNLWFQSTIWPTMALFSIKCTWTLLELTVTERLAVEVEVPFSSKDIILLGDCMNSADIFMQYLGFYDFKLRTRANNKQILEFFTLSHPGGHPRIWNGVSQAVLKVCRELETCFRTHCKPKFDPMSNNIQPSAAPNHNNKNRYGVGHNLEGNADYKSPPLRQRAQTKNMRDLTYPNFEQKPEVTSVGKIFLMSPFILSRAIYEAMKQKIKSWYLYIFNLTKVFHKLDPEVELANALAKSQLIMWGINGIVEIACISIENDKYGVVQRDMKTLLQAFIDLHEALGVYEKNPPVSNSTTPFPVRKDNHDNVNLLLQGCMFALTRIHGRFAPYYEILGVPKGYEAKIVMISQLQRHRMPYLRQQRLVQRS